MRCYKCVIKKVHPCHDNGTLNVACDMRAFNGVDWHKEAREAMVKRRGNNHDQ